MSVRVSRRTTGFLCLCLQVTGGARGCSGPREAAVVKPHFVLREPNSRRSSVAPLCPCDHAACCRLIRLSPARLWQDSQAALIGTTNLFLRMSKKLIQVHHLNSAEGDCHLVKSAKLYKHFFSLKLSINFCAAGIQKQGR